MWAFTKGSRKCGGLQSESVIVFCMTFLYLILPAMADQTTQCPEYTYYDHGTNNCERCNELCDKALHFKTEDQCRELCPAYAQIIWPQKPATPQPPLQPPAPPEKPPPDEPSPPQPPSSAGDHSLGLTVGIPVTGIAFAVALVVVAAGIVLWVKKRHAGGLPRRPAAGDVEANPMLPPATVGPPTSPVAGVQEHGEVSVSLGEALSAVRPGPTQPSPPSGSSGPGGSRGSSSSYVLLSPSPPAPPSGAQRAGGGWVRNPIEEQDMHATAEMTCTGNRPLQQPYQSQSPPDVDGATGLDLEPSLTEAEDLFHSTEVKTSDFSSSPLLSNGNGNGGQCTNYP